MSAAAAGGVRSARSSAEARLIVELDSLLPEITPRLMVGGGRTAETKEMADRVLRRIAASDGWLINPNSAQHEVEEDLARITALGGNVRGPGDCITSAYIHLAPDTMSSAAAKDEQQRAYLDFFGSQRRIEHVNLYALFGTADEVVGQLQQKAAWGQEEIICAMVAPDPEQFERFARMFAKALALGFRPLSSGSPCHGLLPGPSAGPRNERRSRECARPPASPGSARWLPSP